MWNSTKVEKSSTEIEKQMEDYCEFNKDTSRVWKVQNSQIELAEQETVAWAKASVQIRRYIHFICFTQTHRRFGLRLSLSAAAQSHLHFIWVVYVQQY